MCCPDVAVPTRRRGASGPGVTGEGDERVPLGVAVEIRLRLPGTRNIGRRHSCSHRSAALLPPIQRRMPGAARRAHTGPVPCSPLRPPVVSVRQPRVHGLVAREPCVARPGNGLDITGAAADAGCGDVVVGTPSRAECGQLGVGGSGHLSGSWYRVGKPSADDIEVEVCSWTRCFDAAVSAPQSFRSRLPRPAVALAPRRRCCCPRPIDRPSQRRLPRFAASAGRRSSPADSMHMPCAPGGGGALSSAQSSWPGGLDP